MSFNLTFMEVNIKEEVKGLEEKKANTGQLQRVRDKTSTSGLAMFSLYVCATLTIIQILVGVFILSNPVQQNALADNLTETQTGRKVFFK